MGICCYFGPFRSASRIYCRAISLLVFFCAREGSEGLLFVARACRVPFVKRCVLVQSCYFRFNSSISSPILLLPVRFLYFRDIICG